MGAQESVACGPDGEAHQLGRPCGTSPAALQTLADWLGDRGRPPVARASTGVAWLPRWAACAARGLPGGLLRAAASQRVPGRQRAVRAGQGLQPLHRDGLRTASLRPAAAWVAWRPHRRQRAPLLAHRAPPVLPMPHALLQLPRQGSPALSALPGLPGPRILRALVAGARAPQPRAALRPDRCQQEAAERAMAWTGPWRAAPLCVRTPALARCACSTPPLSAGEAPRARACAVLKPRCETTGAVPHAAPLAPPPRRPPHAHRQNAPAGNTRAPLRRIPGGDLGAIHRRSAAMAQTIRSASGTAMRPWPEETPFCAWRGRAPQQESSGGKGRKRRPWKHRNRAPHACRMAAPSVRRSHCAFGAFSRRLQGRLGPAQALGATAPTSARTVEPRRKHRMPYPAIGAAASTQRFRERALQSFQKKAAKLGSTLSVASPLTR